MDFELNDEQRAFQQAARDFAEGELAPHAARWDEESYFCRETLAKAGELGFCGLYTPQEIGGLGLSRLDASIVFEELAGGCTSTTAYLSIHNMATWMVSRWGKPELRERWVADLAAGTLLASYCLTEPQAGSDAASLRTRADLNGDHYLLNGGKAFISGAGSTDLLVVMARTGEAGAGGISSFAVPSDTPGISFGKNEDKMGWKSQPSRTIHFDNVVAPVGNLLGEAGQGFAIAMKGLDGGSINIAACSVG